MPSKLEKSLKHESNPERALLIASGCSTEGLVEAIKDFSTRREKAMGFEQDKPLQLISMTSLYNTP